MDFSALLSQIDKVTTKRTYDDDKVGYWKPTRDQKTGNGSARIRFLPNKDVSDFPFVRMWSHSFKNTDTNRWYIENSLSTINEIDYIAEVNRELWNTGLEDNKKIVSKQKRKLQYISNVLVISDPAHPENNGKVFKFSYGMKIFDKIVAAAKPSETDVDDEGVQLEPINAFDTLDGADFLLNIKIVADFPNYDSSKFTRPKALCNGNEKEIQKILDLCYDLNLEVAPDKFKSKADLEKKYKWVMGETTPAAGSGDKATNDELDKIAKMAADESKKPPVKEAAKEVQKEERKKPPMPTMAPSEDDDAAFFNSLLDE